MCIYLMCVPSATVPSGVDRPGWQLPPQLRVHSSTEQSVPGSSDDYDEDPELDNDGYPVHVRSTRAHPQVGHPPHEPKTERKGHEQKKNEWLKVQDCVAFALNVTAAECVTALALTSRKDLSKESKAAGEAAEVVKAERAENAESG